MFDFKASESSKLTGLFSRPLGAAVASLTLLLVAGHADAKTVYVNANAAPSGKGTSWSSAYKFLRDALDHTAVGDKIFVARGTYYPDDGESGIYGNRACSFDLKGQRIYGGFAGTETDISQRNPVTNPTVLSGAIWSGDNASDFWSLHIVMVKANSTLDGFTIEDGHANGGHSWNYPNITEYDRGGACYVLSGGTLTLANCTVRNNRALADGGAIYVEGDSGKVVATNCTFDHNEIRLDYNITTGSSGGGAIKGNVNATNCRFTANSVTTINFYKGNASVAYGAAIAGKVRATRCEFTGNRVLALATDDVKPTADGGAVCGDFTGAQCVFIDNEVAVTKDAGVSSGGAISGKVVNATSCTFSSNRSGTGLADPEKAVPGGGGAVYTTTGESSLANCVFVGNTSEFRGGAVQGGILREEDGIFISNCTFLDNGVTTGLDGAALSCGGIVRSLNNLFWFTSATSAGLDRNNLIYVGFAGAFRNSDDHYPTPSSAAGNLIKGGESAITRGIISDIYLVSPSLLFVDQDPMFVNISDPDGADNRWGTTDDGLQLQPGSPAIGRILDPRAGGFVDVRPKDLADADQDGNASEKLPVDMLGNVRVQGTFVEIGAYELGNLANVPEIAVAAGATDLVDGTTRSFGKVTRGKNKELSFTIKSVGTNGLSNISVSIEGSKEITLRKANYNTLEPGSTATVTVVFRPKSTGNFSAKLHIVSSDANESPFDITLTGKGVEKTTRKLSAPALSREIPLLLASFSDGGTPVQSTVISNGEKYLTLTLSKESGTSPGTVEVSSDLVNWFSGKNHTTVLEDNSTILRVRDNTPLGAGKRFIRVK